MRHRIGFRRRIIIGADIAAEQRHTGRVRTWKVCRTQVQGVSIVNKVNVFSSADGNDRVLRAHSSNCAQQSAEQKYVRHARPSLSGSTHGCASLQIAITLGWSLAPGAVD